MEKEKLLGLMKGQLIVSCQALPGEAFYDETISLMDRFAIAAQSAGAAMIRANGLRDIQAVKKATGNRSSPFSSRRCDRPGLYP